MTPILAQFIRRRMTALSAKNKLGMWWNEAILFNLRYCSVTCLACEKPRQTPVKTVPRRVSKHGYLK